MEFLDGVLQWLHVLAAAVAVGGVFFFRFVLGPSVNHLPPDQEGAGRQVLQTVSRLFKPVMHTAIALLLLTGVYRLIQVLPLVKDRPDYHTLLGIKLLFALVLFFVAIMLTLPGEQPNYFQRHRDRWLVINFVLGALILLLSATLRRMWGVLG